jgi:hypothetical protein
VAAPRLLLWRLAIEPAPSLLRLAIERAPSLLRRPLPHAHIAACSLLVANVDQGCKS